VQVFIKQHDGAVLIIPIRTVRVTHHVVLEHGEIDPELYNKSKSITITGSNNSDKMVLIIEIRLNYTTNDTDSLYACSE
jgi:hypothetical protein